MSAPKPTYDELAAQVATLERALEDCRGELRRAQGPAKRPEARTPDHEIERALLHFLDVATDGFLLLDSNMRIVRVSTSSGEAVGRSPKEVIGKELREVYVDVEPSGRYEKYVEVLRTGEPFTCDAVFQTEQGEKHVDLRAFRVGDGLGIIAIDITKRKRTEGALQKRREAERRFGQSLAALHSVIVELSAVESFDELCRRAVELGHSRLGFDRLGLWFRVGDPLVVRGSFGIDEDGSVRDERSEQGPVNPNSRMGRVLGRNEQLQFADETGLRNPRGDVVGRGMHAIASLWDGEEVIGCICADNLLDQKPITRRQCQLLGLYASALGHLCSRQRAQELLRESELRYRTLFDGAPVGIGVGTLDGRAFEGNDALLEIVGWSREDVERRSITEVYRDPTERARLLERLAQEGAVRGAEVELRRPDGAVRHVGLSLTHVTLRGEPCLLTVAEDITERKRAEEEILRLNEELGRRVDVRTRELGESEARYHAISEAIPDAVFLYDSERREVVHANDAFHQMYGYAADELAGRSLETYWPVHPADQATIRELSEILQHQPGTRRYPVHRRLRKDGSFFWADITTTDTELRGRPLKLIVTRDVTERRDAEVALRDSEERYRTLAEAAQEHIFIIDRDLHFRYANAFAANQVRRTPEAAIGRPIHEVYPPQTAHTLAHYVRSVFKSGQPIHTEDLFRLTPSAQDPVCLDTRLTPLRDEAGEITSVLGIARDTTRRRLAEEARRESEERYRRVVEDQTELICRFRPTGELTFVNGAYCRYFDKTPEELIGHGFIPLIPEEDRSKPHDCIAALSPENPMGHVEHQVIGPDGGERRWLRWTNRLILDDQGNPLEYQAVGRDVTEQRRAEEALRRTQRERAAILNSMTEHVIYHDRDMVIVWANRAACDSVGLTPQQVTGNTCYDLWHGRSSPCDGCPVKRTLETSQPHAQEMATPDGRQWLVRSSPVQDENGALVGVVEITVDITERRQAEEALRESEARYRALFHQAVDSVVLMDAETGALVEFNDRAHEILGYTRQEFARLRLSDIEAVESRQGVAAHLDRIATEGSDDFETTQRTKGGEVRDIHVRCAAIPIHGKLFIQGVWRDVTEQKQAAEALRESELKYRTLFEASTDAIFLETLDGRIHDCNGSACRMYGYTKDELCGLTVADIVPESVAAALPDAVTEQLTTGGLFVEALGVRKGGSHFPTEVNTRLTTIGGERRVVAYVRDITEQKRSREQIERQAMLLANVTDVVAVADSDRAMTYWNRGAEEVFGYSQDEMLGRTGLELLLRDAGQGADIAATVESAIKERVVWSHGRLPCRRKDGEDVWVNIRASALTSGPGEPEGVLFVARDVTGSVLLEQRLILAERMATVGTLGLSVAHELNNMLGGLHGLADLATGNETLVPRLIEACRAVAERGGAIAGRMTSLAKADVRGEERHLDIGSVARTVVGMMRPSLAPRNITVNESYAPVPRTWMNEGQILQVLLNLVANARDGIGRGGCIEVSVAPEAGGDCIAVSVRDDGAGIAPEDLSRLFDPFFTTKVAPGPEGEEPSHLGLGLPESLAIANEYGGTIDVDTEAGQGATFTVRLPVRSAPTAVIEPRVPAAAPPETGTRMLVADDDELMRFWLAEHLTEEGYEVVAVATGQEAIAACREEDFSYIFLDMLMPGEIDGAAGFRALHEMQPDAKIIISTAFVAENVPEDCRRAAHAMLKKPFGKDDLTKALAGQGSSE